MFYFNSSEDTKESCPFCAADSTVSVYRSVTLPYLHGSIVVESRIDSLLFEVHISLEEGAAQGVDGPFTELTERHLQEDAITRRDQLNVRQTMRHRFTFQYKAADITDIINNVNYVQ